MEPLSLWKAAKRAPHVPHGRPDSRDRPDLGDLRVRDRARITLRDDARHDDGSALSGSDSGTHPNAEMFGMARDIAALLGRRPATANEYRRLIGKPGRT